MEEYQSSFSRDICLEFQKHECKGGWQWDKFIKANRPERPYLSCSPLARAKINLERKIHSHTLSFLFCSYNSSISSKIPLWSHKILAASAFLRLRMLVKSKYAEAVYVPNPHLTELLRKASFKSPTVCFSEQGSSVFVSVPTKL